MSKQKFVLLLILVVVAFVTVTSFAYISKPQIHKTVILRLLK